jgi:FAD/FMN-containing dehydrogenase
VQEEIMRHPKSIEEFIGTFRGRLIQREDPEYDEARSIYNAMIDKRPLLIAQCADVADVMACVSFAREEGLDLAVRGGGHNGAGLALVDDGIVVDLSRMKGIRVDPEAKSVRVEAGCRWQDVDHATHAFGLATVSGIIANTGVGGLTLGGGHGYLTRKYGLTIDNLLSADVVLADGTLVHASENDNPDLFWALRGGGGNFGIVTSFEYRLHPVENVVGGPVLWSLDDLETTMRWYRDWLPSAPDDVYAYYLVMEVPPVDHFPVSLHGRKVCGMFVCYTGPADHSDEVLAPIREVAAPVAEMVHEMPYPMLQSMLDDLYPPGLQWYWKGDFVREISDEAVTQHRRFAEVPTPHSTMHLYPVDGAAHRSASDATAWGHRDATWSMVIAGVDPRPSKKDAIESWARDYWNALHPHSLGAAYINFMMEEGQERVRAFYGDNYDELRRIKTKYDPDNFFHVNQNVKPLC